MPSENPTTFQPTATPTLSDVISSSEGCKDVDFTIDCKAELLDGFVVDCQSVMFAQTTQKTIKVIWGYRITNNCPHMRILARQSMTGCSVCVPSGLECTQASTLFQPTSPQNRKVTLAPGESAVEIEEETIDLTKSDTGCMYSRDVVLRIKGGEASTGSFAIDKKLSFVGPRK
jgi:hypothetical protein